MTRTELYSACSTLPALESMSVPSTSGCPSLRPVGKACVAVVSPDTLVTPKLQKFSWKPLWKLSEKSLPSCFTATLSLQTGQCPCTRLQESASSFSPDLGTSISQTPAELGTLLSSLHVAERCVHCYIQSLKLSLGLRISEYKAPILPPPHKIFLLWTLMLSVCHRIGISHSNSFLSKESFKKPSNFGASAPPSRTLPP